jgi:uncharacterized SAM-dependent methyltransferase
MHLVSLSAQSVTVAGRDFHFSAGESIHTESSRKYDIPGFTELASRNGWHVERVWTDDRVQFALFALT